MSLGFPTAYNSYLGPGHPLMELPSCHVPAGNARRDIPDRALWNTIFHSYPRRHLEPLSSQDRPLGAAPSINAPYGL